MRATRRLGTRIAAAMLAVLTHAPFSAPGIAQAPQPNVPPGSQPLLPAPLPGPLLGQPGQGFPGQGGTLGQGQSLPGLPPGMSPDVVQRLIDQLGARGQAPQVNAAPRLPQPMPPSVELPFPAQAAAPEEPPSPTEAFFQARAGVALRLFGHGQLGAFAGGAPPLAAVPSGGVPEDYVLGPEDELVVTFRGRARSSVQLRIDRDGRLVLPELPPVPAAGRRLGELRADLEARVGRDLPGTEVFVSVVNLRALSVFVGGEVARPGVQALSPLGSVLDALAAAGGVRRTGSLRGVQVARGGQIRTADLYEVLAGTGTSSDWSIRAGDRLLVPALGPVAAVAGDVGRPGIYEFPPGQTRLAMAELVALAGGTLRPAGNRYLLETFDGSGRRSTSEAGLGSQVPRGALVTITAAVEASVGEVRLGGHAAVPLSRSRGAAPRLRALLSDPRVLSPDPYPRLAVIRRVDPATRAIGFVPFDLGAVLGGQADAPLAEGDTVLVFSRADVAFLASAPVQKVLRGDLPMPDACVALQALASLVQVGPGRFAHARGAGFLEAQALPCPSVLVDYPDLLPVLLDQVAQVTGEVRRPGLYPLLPGAGLDAVLAVAGGPTDAADLSNVELSRQPVALDAPTVPMVRQVYDIRSRNYGFLKLEPRDVVRFARAFTDRDAGPVFLAGEFVRPGSYDIRRGERLSDVIARAGGLTPQAFPYGAVFTRDSVRRRQQEGFERTARELETTLMQLAAAQALTPGSGTRGPQIDVGDAIRAGRELAGSLRLAQAAGRLVIEANPVALAADPSRDLLLEPGDLLVMPKRPNEVSVIGAVLNPGSLQFESGRRPVDYLRAAGGPQRFADTGRAFLILPNGQSQPAGLSSWNYSNISVPPGSTLVVPQDPSPYETWGIIRDLTQVVSQIAISGAALAVIAREAN